MDRLKAPAEIELSVVKSRHRDGRLSLRAEGGASFRVALMKAGYTEGDLVRLVPVSTGTARNPFDEDQT